MKRRDNGLLLMVCEPEFDNFYPHLWEMIHKVDVILRGGGSIRVTHRFPDADLGQANAVLYWPSCRVGGEPNPFNRKRIERIMRLRCERPALSLEDAEETDG